MDQSEPREPRERDPHRARAVADEAPHGGRAPPHELRARNDNRLTLDVHPITSTLKATAFPPPRHSVARPVAFRCCCRAYSSVVSTRAPEAPIGWPNAMAPPCTLTRLQSQPSAWPSARAWTA